MVIATVTVVVVLVASVMEAELLPQSTQAYFGVVVANCWSSLYGFGLFR